MAQKRSLAQIPHIVNKATRGGGMLERINASASVTRIKAIVIGV